MADDRGPWEPGDGGEGYEPWPDRGRARRRIIALIVVAAMVLTAGLAAGIQIVAGAA